MRTDADSRIVMTLDAGGTNFVFSAIRANREIVAPITLPSAAGQLDLCLQTIVDGFSRVRAALPQPSVAISFAFPGPADYASGIIGDLGNLPAFRGGVALGPMLREKFGLPVFINNDGDLFAYGEAIAGLLPEINAKLSAAGSPKQFGNLFGITLGTGFGGGIVRNGALFVGDNGAAGEIWIMRNKLHNRAFAEEGASIRAVEQVYLAHAKTTHPQPPSPKEIFEFATGRAGGDRAAALRAFDELGETVGDALANAMTLIDGLVVIGGGLSGAASLFLPRIVAEMNGTIETLQGVKIPRMELKAFNLEDEEQLRAFLCGDVRVLSVPGSDAKVAYDPLKRIGVGLSRLGTSQAVAIGAYAFALHALDGAAR
ncbi:MAG: ROK family protein [Thermoguttaceae bacterium]|jgi:glucokinase